MADENVVKVEEITNENQRCGVGEGPHWDVSKQSLYYVDIIAPSIQRFDAVSGEIFKATVSGDISAIGFIIPVEGSDDEFIIGADRKLLKIRWDGNSTKAETLQQLDEVDKCCPGNRINDGKCDPNGILFFGTMGDESSPDFGKQFEGSFFRFSPKSGVELQRRNIGISNGLSWDVKRTDPKFYYIGKCDTNKTKLKFPT
jgi:gluconolactonase